VATTTDPQSHPVLSSLRDFLFAGIRPRTPLARAIVLVLVLKLAVVVSMQVFLLLGKAQPDVNAAAILSVLGPATH